MYTWKQFSSLPGIKGLEPREQWQKFYMYEASNTSAAASSAAGAGAGGGSLSPITSGNGTLFLDDYKDNWSFFTADEAGKKTRTINTGVDRLDYYLQQSYIIDKKGYVLIFTDEVVFKVLYINESGRIVRTDSVPTTYDYEIVSCRYFYMKSDNDDAGYRTITYFDGENVYDVQFGAPGEYSTAYVDTETNYYLYETTSISETEAYMDSSASGAGLIVVDNLDGDTNEKYYSVYNGNKLLINEEQDNHYYSYTWDVYSGFGVVVDYDANEGIYSSIRIVDLRTGDDIYTIDVSTGAYASHDYVFYGTGKVANILWSTPGSVYKIYVFDGTTREIVVYEHERMNYNYDFFCTQKAAVYGYEIETENTFERNFISEDIVFTFRSSTSEINNLEYFDNFDILYIPASVFDGGQSNLVELTDTGVEPNLGMFTNNVFTMLSDISGTSSTPGDFGCLIISEDDDTTHNFGFGNSIYNGVWFYQLNDGFVYKFFFNEDRDEVHIFDTNGNLEFDGNSPPANSFYNSGGLFAMSNYEDEITYYYNNTTKGLSPSLVPLTGPDSGNQFYDDEYWLTFHNTPGNISDGILLLRGTDNSNTDNFVLLTENAAPVFFDFSYIDGLNHNIYLCKTFIIVQYRDGDGNGFAKVYDHSGNLKQDLSFGHCLWISNDAVVGDMAVIRFTSSGTTKRVFVSKNRHHTYDLVWDPYSHYTLFNDARWFNWD